MRKALPQESSRYGVDQAVNLSANNLFPGADGSPARHELTRKWRSPPTR